MTIRRIILLSICFATLIGVNARAAGTTTLTLVQGQNGYFGFNDTSIFSENQNSGGGTDGIFSGTNGQLDTRRALIRADLSMIPPGSTITSVSLQLTVWMSGENFGEFDYTLHKSLKHWGEGTVAGLSEGGFGGAPNPGDATWVSNFHTTSMWSNLGGDYSPNVSATAPAGLAGSNAVWSDNGMVADLQSWIDAPASNYGWFIVSTIEGQSKRVKKFRSAESPILRPVLIVEYTPPPQALTLHTGVATAFTLLAFTIVFLRYHYR